MTAQRSGARDTALWTSALERLARAAQSNSGLARPTEERANEILARRARNLAAPLAKAQPERMLDVVVFALANERIAIESRYLRAVVKFGDVTPMPGGAAFLAGVANFRGEILPIFDLRDALGISMTAPFAPSRILVLGLDRTEFGLAVDAVEDAISVPAASVRTYKAGGAATSHNAITGGITDAALLVLDGQALLSDARFFAERTDTTDPLLRETGP